eukprot:scaffold16130_cov69-Phaeocystis_antarctica.AAC.2
MYRSAAMPVAEVSAEACSVAIVTTGARRGAPDSPMNGEPTRRPSAHASADKKRVDLCIRLGALGGDRGWRRRADDLINLLRN